MEEYISGDKNQVVRRKAIMDMLQDRDVVRVLELCELFQVSQEFQFYLIIKPHRVNLCFFTQDILMLVAFS